MQSKLFQILMCFLAIGMLASCKKETLDQAPAASPEVKLDDSLDNHTSLLIPVLSKRIAELTTKTSTGAKTTTFTHDASGRLAKVVTPDHTTTYTYTNGILKIKRFFNASLGVIFEMSGPLNGYGYLKSLEGYMSNLYAGAVKVKYEYTYDATKRLTQWKSTIGSGDKISYGEMKYVWSNGNIMNAKYYNNGKLQETRYMLYDTAMVDKRGVWKEFNDIWADKFLGLRNKHANTRMVRDNASNVTIEFVQHTWYFDAEKFPTATLDITKEGAILRQNFYKYQ